jgi:phosphonate transport system substrate-binding protein
MPDAIDQISKGEVSIAYLTPVAYINSHNRAATRLVAKTVTDKRSTFRLMIVVREDSPIKNVEDLKGKLFAFGDKAALLQRAVVADVMPLNQLGAYKFIGHYDNIAQGVMNGDFDAGILKDTTAYAWREKGLRILYESPDLPPYNIAVSANVDDQLFKQIQQAFLKLDVNDPKQREVIHSLDKHYDGFAPTSDQEYDVVRRLIAPFVKAKH